jgi:hypothetical protein
LLSHFKPAAFAQQLLLTVSVLSMEEISLPHRIDVVEIILDLIAVQLYG